MKYTLNINQRAVIENNFDLDIIDCAIINQLMTFSHSNTIVKIYLDGQSYYWFNHENISKQLPILKLKKDAVYRRLKSLCEKGFLKQNPNNKQMNVSYYAFTEKCILLENSPSFEEPNPSYRNPNPSVEEPNNNYIINNNNIKNKKESKDSYMDISSTLFGEEDSISKQPKEKEGKEKSSAKKEKAAEFTTFHFKQELIEMGADSEHVDDWISVRKAKKGSNTRTALKGFINACTKAGISVAEGVHKCAEKSWCSLEASWITPNEPKKEELSNQRTINM